MTNPKTESPLKHVWDLLERFPSPRSGWTRAHRSNCSGNTGRLAPCRYVSWKTALATACLLTLNHVSHARADGPGFRTAMADAVRAAAGVALPSIVTVEIVGVSGRAGGEVEQDAPTSGIVIDPDGYVLASSQVVARPAASVLVVLPDGTRHAAEVVARDHRRELVLLKIGTTEPLDAVTLPDELDLRIGRSTVAVGRYGAKGSPLVSTGILSAVDRLDGIALQTDARVSPAFYGGPLLDLYGNVLGVLIPAVAEGGAPDATSWYDSGIAFAIPATIIRKKIDRLKSGEDIKKGLIGIVLKAKDPYDNDTELAAVRTRSPAESAGLEPGDEIVAVAGTRVNRHQEIKQVLGRFDAGETIAIRYRRGEQTRDVEITLTDSIPPLQPQRLGIAVRQQGGQDDEVESVVVDAVLPKSPADGSLETGDVIVKLNAAQISDVQSLRRQMITAEPNRPISLVISRDESRQTVTIEPSSISGTAITELPDGWRAEDEPEWKVEELKLPDAANAAAVVIPPQEDDVRREGAAMGLLVLLQAAGQPAPTDELKSWASAARDNGVVVCAIASEDTKRWQPKEIDVVTRMAAAAMKRADISSSAVGIAATGSLAGTQSEASDSMALAIALSASETFRGVAVSENTRAPAVRLRENDAVTSLQILLPIKSPDDAPAWATALTEAGYPIVRGGDVDKDALLRWARLLQAI